MLLGRVVLIRVWSVVTPVVRWLLVACVSTVGDRLAMTFPSRLVCVGLPSTLIIRGFMIAVIVVRKVPSPV